MSDELEPGAIVAQRFRLERELGAGGMGVVWLAQHTKTKKRVALKLVKPGAAPEQGKRLYREARAASVIRHPNVREVFDVLEDGEGSPIIVMEYLEGRPLGALLADKPRLTLERTAEILVPVLSAVGTAHALGIVHRDLKPDNIFLVEQPAPTVKVVDFGIAKLTATEGDAAATAGITGTGSIVGTPHFMAPEQVFGERHIDYRADVWALGLLAYRMLSGVLPTEAENVGQVMKIIVSRGIPPLRSVAPELPEEVAHTVDKMLARSPDERLADLGDVLAVLQPHTQVEAPSFEGPASVVAANVELAGAPTADRSMRAPETGVVTRDARPAAEGGGRRWLAVGAAVVALGGGGALLASTRVAEPTPGATSGAAAGVGASASSPPTTTPAAPTAPSTAVRVGRSASSDATPRPSASTRAQTPASRPGATSATPVAPPTAEPVPTVQVQTAW